MCPRTGASQAAGAWSLPGERLVWCACAGSVTRLCTGAAGAGGGQGVSPCLGKPFGEVGAVPGDGRAGCVWHGWVQGSARAHARMKLSSFPAVPGNHVSPGGGRGRHCNGSIHFLLAFSDGNVVLNGDAPPDRGLGKIRSGNPMNSKDKVTVINDKTAFG